MQRPWPLSVQSIRAGGGQGLTSDHCLRLRCLCYKRRQSDPVRWTQMSGAFNYMLGVRMRHCHCASTKGAEYLTVRSDG